jgi:hypothetical protein
MTYTTNSQEIRKILNVLEARTPSDDISYTDEKDKVTIDVKGRKSAEITKLAKQFMEVKKLEKDLKETKDSMTDSIKNVAEALFDAEDALKTKYIKTVSVAMTITKDISASKKEEFDIDGFFSELHNLLDKEIVSKLLDLKEKYTNIKDVAGRKGSLRDVKIKEEVISESFMSNLKDWASDFANKITKKLPIFDKKLQKLMKRYGLS